MNLDFQENILTVYFGVFYFNYKKNFWELTGIGLSLFFFLGIFGKCQLFNKKVKGEEVVIEEILVDKF